MAKKSESKRIVKAIINRLFGLVLVFYGAMFGANALGITKDIADAMENAGTLTLGSFLTIIKDKFDEESGEKDEEGEDPIASNGNLTANEVYEDQDWS